ncbi:dihydrofolate reductase [Aricia agestis]|uniref:dihydrofolate reductase n=1 Tax=Aricia agestis TaxID=91739 RepID=UPI001C208201|nr:dihydrofolate reductase [Aricia agestis]
MSKVKLNLIAAACENMGIGINGDLPWRLKNEMAYFTRMTTNVQDKNKVNAVIMGRRTWDSIPPKYSPLQDRLNIVLTRKVEAIREKVPEGVIVLSGIDEAIEYIEEHKNIESAWVIGGSSIYKLGMDHANCDKIYLTEIQKTYESDTFFPDIDKDKFKLITEDNVPTERQTENRIDYFFRIYKKVC